MRRSAIAAAAIAGLIGLGIGALGIGAALDKEPAQAALSSADIQTAMAACNEAGPQDAISRCLSPWIEEAIQQGSLPAIGQYLEQAGTTLPEVVVACHDGAHLAGRNIAQRGSEPIDALLDRVAGTVFCEGGLVHGTLDQFSTMTPSTEEVQAAVRGCSQIVDDGTRSLCADGVGHAAWQATSDPVAALEWCAEFTVFKERESCIGGILMQLGRVYTDGRQPAYNFATEPQSLPDLCTSGRAAIPAQRDIDSCYDAAARVLSSVGADDGNRWARKVSSGGDATREWETLKNTWVAVLGHCRHFPEAYRDTCERAIVATSGFTVPPVYQLHDKLCEVWSSPRDRELCISAAN